MVNEGIHISFTDDFYQNTLILIQETRNYYSLETLLLAYNEYNKTKYTGLKNYNITYKIYTRNRIVSHVYGSDNPCTSKKHRQQEKEQQQKWFYFPKLDNISALLQLSSLTMDMYLYYALALRDSLNWVQ